MGVGLIFLVVLTAYTVGESSEPETPNIVVLSVPAGPGSSSPNLAVGPDGSVVLSWLETDGPGHALKYSTLDGNGWANAETIAKGDNWFVNWADFPSVIPISETLWAAHWLVSQPAGGYAYDVFVALSTDSGQSWSEPLIPHRDGTATEHGFVTLYPNDTGVGLVWLDGRNMANEQSDDVGVSGMTLRAASLSPDLVLSSEAKIDGLICDCCQTDVARTSDGPVAIYRDRTSDEIRDNYVSRYVDNHWQEGKPLGNDNWNIPGCPVNGPVIEANENSVVAAWFTAANDIPRIQAGFSEDSAESFSAPINVVSEETLGRVGLALLPDGDVAVSWLRKASADSAEVCVRRVSADGALGPVVVISKGDDVPRFSVPRMVRACGELIFAWTRRIDDASHVITASVPVNTL